MGKAPEICLYCDKEGNSRAGGLCGFCIEGKPLDTQEDWDNSWGKTFENIKRRNLGSWHHEVFEEMGWNERECKASISGKCLAVTRNEPFCHPDCENDTMEGNNKREEGDV